MPRVVRYGLLAVLLLLGRSALIVHDATHWQPKLQGEICELCLYHVGQDDIAVGDLTFTPDRVPPPRMATERVHSLVLPPHRRHPIRGPPSFFD
ncbi:MAG: hypothetical protein ACREVL_17885 [Solimonas sp.]